MSRYWPRRSSSYRPERSQDRYRTRDDRNHYTPHSSHSSGGHSSSYSAYHYSPSHYSPKRAPRPLTYEEKFDVAHKEFLAKHPSDFADAFPDQTHTTDPFTGIPFSMPAAQPPKPSYRMTYDPELERDLRPIKGKQPIYRFKGEGLPPPKDPRIPIKASYGKYCLLKKSKRPPYKSLIVPVFTYDKHSHGDPPSCEIAVWNFPPNFNVNILKLNFAKYGKVLEAQLSTDPVSATPLGVCRIKYDDNNGKDITGAHKAALAAIRDAHEKLVLGRHPIKCGLNTKKNGLLEKKEAAAINAFQERKRAQQKARETELARKKQLEAKRKAEKERQRWKAQEEERRREEKRRQLLKSKNKGLFGAEGQKVIVPEDVAKLIDGRPFFFLSNEYCPTDQFDVKELKSRLLRYPWAKILDSAGVGFYVVFSNRNAATRCFNEQNHRVFYKEHAELQLCLDASSFEIQRPISLDPVEDATEQLMRDLVAALKKDIKDRTIGPTVLAHLDRKHVPPPVQVEEPQEVATKANDDVFGIGNVLPRKLKLPSFRRKRKTKDVISRMMEDSDEELSVKRVKKEKRDKRERIRKEIEDWEDEEPESEKEAEEESKEEMLPEEDLDTKKRKREESEDLHTDYTKTLGETNYVSSDIKAPALLTTIQENIHDDEDWELLQEVFADVEPVPVRSIEYWSWRNKTSFTESGPSILPELENSSGSFRSEGYRKIPDALKAEYLPHRRKVHRHEPLSTLKTNEEDSKTIQSSRVNRANNRRLAADTKQILGLETDVLKLNALAKRKKPVNFARSAIHNWGLYALEPIAANEMIIEYVGDCIRQQVAEQREKQYLKSGIGSSYLFRIDEQTVIDATKKGGIARFINHCCTPSCTAKIIKVDGKKRIVIYALKDIKANEELTYDYKFERETNDEERIACLCGAPGCKGFLN